MWAPRATSRRPGASRPSESGPGTRKLVDQVERQGNRHGQQDAHDPDLERDPVEPADRGLAGRVPGEHVVVGRRRVGAGCGCWPMPRSLKIGPVTLILSAQGSVQDTGTRIVSAAGPLSRTVTTADAALPALRQVDRDP